jgi:Protein of unknown function (DUF3253)
VSSDDINVPSVRARIASGMPTAREAILDLLSRRDEGKTICPSEAARAAEVSMDAVREAARTLVDEGEIVITQKGEVVDLASVRGPIRLRRSADRP